MWYNNNMSETYSHKCIKCKEVYVTEDDEAYLCEKCFSLKKKIAEEIDKKMAGRLDQPRQKSDLQLYDEICKKHGSKYVNMRDMGISI